MGAEGVNTDQSWPRLLEADLAASVPGRPVQVMNFAITGYGPNQYAAVVKHFVPQFHPDLVLIGPFINDYGDALTSDDEFRESIGFGRPDPDGLASILSFRQLASLCRVNFMAAANRLRHKPDADGLLFGQFYFLRRDCPDLAGEGRAIVTPRLAEIRQTAEGNGARVVIVMIPSAPQVCGRAHLPYWPSGVDVADTRLFDLDGPQRVTSEIAAGLLIPCYDLRPALRPPYSAGCPYQPHNIHFTPVGHRRTADYVAAELLRDGYIR
jgi:hypothetical protein